MLKVVAVLLRAGKSARLLAATRIAGGVWAATPKSRKATLHASYFRTDMSWSRATWVVGLVLLALSARGSLRHHWRAHHAKPTLPRGART